MAYKNYEAQKAYQRAWVAKRRASFFKDKCCQWCHAREDLELHHLDPERKENHAIWSWGEKRRETEIAKCIVLCKPCHVRAHSEVRRLEAELRNPHGTRNRYDLGCRCPDCRFGQAGIQPGSSSEESGVSPSASVGRFPPGVSGSMFAALPGRCGHVPLT